MCFDMQWLSFFEFGGRFTLDVLLIIAGFISAISSLVLSIIAIVRGTSKVAPLLLLALGVSLIKLGRELGRKKD